MRHVKTKILKILTTAGIILMMQLLLWAGAFAKPVMKDLGTLGGIGSWATSINDNGQVIGQSYTKDNAEHGFIWENGKMADLGTLGGDKTNVLAINAKGQVIGTSYLSDNKTQHGFIWQNGKMTDLGTLGGNNTIVVAINNNGQIVGNSLLANGTYHGFIWENGEMTDLGALGIDSFAVAINEKGQVIGYSHLTNDATSMRGFIWRNGEMTDLGTLGGKYTYVAAINEKGQVVGYSYLEDNRIHHGFIWENGKMTDLGALGENSEAGIINNKGLVVGNNGTHPFIWENGKMTDLGTLDGYYTNPFALNENGKVIGYSYLSDGSYCGFLWENNKMVALKAMGNYSTNVTAINDNGLIAGYASIPNDHVYYAYIWINGGMLDLKTKPPYVNDGVSYTYNSLVYGINNKGQVVGSYFIPNSGQNGCIWEDDGTPTITINPYNTDPTNKDITVTASVYNGTPLNETSHTFTQDGSYTFTATNDAGTSSETVTITNIDKTPPVISINGNAMEYVKCIDNYSDKGAKAIDDKDGDISSLISVSGRVNTFVPGEYNLIYSVQDKAGNAAAPVKRTVIVVNELNSVTPSEVLYDARKLPAFSVTLSKVNKLIDIKNGSASLNSGKDYTVSGSALSIAPGYLNYYFNKFPGQDLKLVLYFNEGNTSTLTVRPVWEQVHTITPSEIKVDKSKINDVSVSMDVFDMVLVSVNNGSSALDPANDYSVSGNVVTIKKSYINYYFSKFPGQNLNLIFKFYDGSEQVLSIYTGSSPNTTIAPAVETYKVGSKTDVAVTANMNGNFFSSINNGTSALIPRIDYTYEAATNTLYIKSSYIAYYFGKFHQDLLLTVNFTGGKPATLTIKPDWGSETAVTALNTK